MSSDRFLLTRISAILNKNEIVWKEIFSVDKKLMLFNPAFISTAGKFILLKRIHVGWNSVEKKKMFFKSESIAVIRILIFF